MDNGYTRISRREIENLNKTTLKATGNSIVEVPGHQVSSFEDALFFERVVFNFENNKYVNSLYINELHDKSLTEHGECTNIQFDQVKSYIKIKEGFSYGEYYTSEIYTHDSKKANINDFFLIVDQEIPTGCEIVYSLITDKDEVFPILPNNTTPCKIKREDDLPNKVRIRARIYSNSTQKSPIIKGIAVLYHCSFTAAQLGLLNPDIGRLPETEYPNTFEVTTLYRDPANDDKLVKVSNTIEDVILEYNEYDELAMISTKRTLSGELKDETSLIYDDYTNSAGEKERVLMYIAREDKQVSSKQ